MEGRRHFDLYNPEISTYLCGSSLCLWSHVASCFLCSQLSHPPSVSLCRVQGKRKGDSYVRVLGWPVKAPLFPALWSARLTNSSWSAAYVWTATKTPKYCPACTPSVRGELLCCFSMLWCVKPESDAACTLTWDAASLLPTLVCWYQRLWQLAFVSDTKEKPWTVPVSPFAPGASVESWKRASCFLFLIY